MKKQNKQYDIVRPQPESLLQSARSFGYSVETALADLIDNSITAEATDIKITFGIDRYSSYIKIEDNGKGMSEKQLLNAMKMGSFNPLDDRNSNDLGRFGLGLKTASFSQCKRLTVKTRNRSNKEFIRCWDLDIVKEKRDWILLRNCADRNSEKILDEFSNIGPGTIVLWEKLDRLIELEELKSDKEHFYRKFSNVRKHLGLVFHRFIEEKRIKISVLNEELQPINPFYISNDYPSTELPEEHLSIKQQDIYIQPFILPHESKISNIERDNLEITKGWVEHQGIYLYRNKRLIVDGNWLNLGFKNKENQRLCRIRIDIPNTLDPEWQIDVKKASSKIPDVIRKRIKTICFNSIEKAVKVYTHRGAYLKRTNSKKEVVYLWKAKQKKGKRFYEINKEHPIYNLIINYLGEEALIFNDYMKLVGESLPISFIVSDFSDQSLIMKDFFEDSKKELKLIYENTLSALINAGFSEKEATEKVNSIECFQQLK